MVIDIADGDVQPHIGRLLSIVRAHKKGILGAALSVQLLGGDQVAGFWVDTETVIRPADDGVSHKRIGTLKRKTENCYLYMIRLYMLKVNQTVGYCSAK